MNKKLLIRIIVVFVIAAATLFFAAALAVPTLALWIFLVWIVWKKKINIFHDQIEPKLAERRLKRLKTFLLVAAISFAVGIAGVIVHNALYGLSEIEEPVSFVIALVALWVFVIATIGGLVILLKGRQKLPERNTEISTI